VRNGLLQFAEKSREELIEEILRLEKENEALKRKLQGNEEAGRRRQELKFLRLQAQKTRSRKPGQKIGHVGMTRQKPDHPNRIIERRLKACPDCHQPLSRTQETIDHTQEDIVPAQVEVTLYKRHRHYCKHCKKLVTAPYAPDQVPHGYLGPNALIHMAILKYHHALPGNKIVELFNEIFGMKVSEGAVSQALQRLGEWLKVETDEVLKAIRRSPHIHMDETGWKVNGKGHWLWAFVNEKLTYYRIDKSRGNKVPKQIIPTDYGGILISDFYAAYNQLPGEKQKCLVHLMREMKRCHDLSRGHEFKKHHKQLKRILYDALKLDEQRKNILKSVLYSRIRRIQQRLLDWSIRDYKDKHLTRLAKRFLKHWFELLTFLEKPGLPYHNNLCERQIRHNVIIRNRSFQNRSPKGAKAHEVLMSLLQTFRLRREAPIPFLKKAYLSHRQGNPTPLFAP
jgi:transposase